SLLQIVEG
ncbi:hypothetical protein VCPCS022_003438B, partial [Vibrio cholerae O1 str. PCS-022]